MCSACASIGLTTGLASLTSFIASARVRPCACIRYCTTEAADRDLPEGETESARERESEKARVWVDVGGLAVVGKVVVVDGSPLLKEAQRARMGKQNKENQPRRFFCV